MIKIPKITSSKHSKLKNTVHFGTFILSHCHTFALSYFPNFAITVEHSNLQGQSYPAIITIPIYDVLPLCIPSSFLFDLWFGGLYQRHHINGVGDWSDRQLLAKDILNITHLEASTYWFERGTLSFKWLGVNLWPICPQSSCQHVVPQPKGGHKWPMWPSNVYCMGFNVNLRQIYQLRQELFLLPWATSSTTRQLLTLSQLCNRVSHYSPRITRFAIRLVSHNV